MVLPEQGFSYTLTQGSSLAKLSYQLHKQKILDHPRWLIAYARLWAGADVQAGEYQLAAGTTPSELLWKLQRGDVLDYPLTLVEGWTFYQALEALQQDVNVVSLLKGKTQAEQLALLKLDVSHPEGWFFPDTYRYTKGTTDVELLQRAHARMKRIVDELWLNRAEDLPYQSAYDALIMASIVERETGQASEREQIAGVFVRRLKKRMRLQTDPTVIYGLGPKFDGNIRRKHLKQETAYNTYMIKGLPPTPIALPGREAIWAALHPDDGNTLYFVAKGDGSHYFSSTLEEHNKAVQQYQIKHRVKTYRSAPVENNNK